MSYKSMFQDVRDGVDWVHFKVESCLFTIKPVSSQLWYISYIQFIHNPQFTDLCVYTGLLKRENSWKPGEVCG